MGIIDQIIDDVASITSDAGAFGVSITLTAPNGQTATIVGTHTKHHLGVTEDGDMVNSRKVNIAFSEKVLIAANAIYPLRNGAGEVDMHKHKVSVKDSTGIAKTYIIHPGAWFPDEQCGLIVCILSVFG
jgi:hypothetical protein